MSNNSGVQRWRDVLNQDQDEMCFSLLFFCYPPNSRQENRQQMRPLVNQWPVTPDHYMVESLVGSGGTSSVYEAFCFDRKEECVIKVLNLAKCRVLENGSTEVRVLEKLRHENVITYHASFVVETNLWIILKNMKGGTLYDYISYFHARNENYVFNENMMASILKQIINGLSYIHDNGFIHRDLKSNNILVDLDGTICIGDFGFSTTIDVIGDPNVPKRRFSVIGTPTWMAPELKSQCGYDNKIDIYSFGVLAMEMVKGNIPIIDTSSSFKKFLNHKTMANGEIITENDPIEKILKPYSSSLRKLITKCLMTDPNERPSAKELLTHPFFKKAKSIKYVRRNMVDKRYT